MDSELKFCRECGKSRNIDEEKCSECGWSFPPSKNLSPLRGELVVRNKVSYRDIKVHRKYDTLQVLMWLIVAIQALVAFVALGAFLTAWSKSSLFFSLPALGWLIGALVSVVAAVALRQFILIFIDIEWGLRKLIALQEYKMEE